MIACCAADLLWSSRVMSTAGTMGLQCRSVRDVAALTHLLDAGEVTGVLVDLELGESAYELIAAAAAHKNEARQTPLIVAFGSHTDRPALERARAAGAERVLTRGALAAHLQEVLEGLSRGEVGEPGGLNKP